MVTRIFSDPDLQRQVQAILPRMSFEITSVSYDASRKQNSLLKASRPIANDGTRASSAYMGVPYDITFQLTVYARNVDDGTHVVEQIMPFFNPDFTVTANMVPDLALLKDIPVILNSVTNDIEYEGNFDSVRYVYWTLNFTMKTYFYGGVTTPKIIRSVYTNIYQDESLKSGYLARINTTNVRPNSTFKLDDFVFQGNSFNTANAYGIVLNYDKLNSRLVLGAVQGQFKTNAIIHAVSTNAYATIESFVDSPLLLAGIKITPNPIDALPTDDYGYTTEIIEFPRTQYRSQFANTVIHFTTDTVMIRTSNTTINTDKTDA